MTSTGSPEPPPTQRPGDLGHPGIPVGIGYDSAEPQLWFYVTGASGTAYLTTDLDLQRIGRIYRAD